MDERRDVVEPMQTDVGDVQRAELDRRQATAPASETRNHFMLIISIRRNASHHSDGLRSCSFVRKRKQLLKYIENCQR